MIRDINGKTKTANLLRIPPPVFKINLKNWYLEHKFICCQSTPTTPPKKKKLDKKYKQEGYRK